MSSKSTLGPCSEFQIVSDVSSGTIAAVDYDLAHDGIAVQEIMARLAHSNPAMAIGILAQARNVKEHATDPETAYIHGALSILGILVKQEKARNMAQLLFEINISAGQVMKPDLSVPFPLTAA